MIIFKSKYAQDEVVTKQHALVLAKVKFSQLEGTTLDKVKLVNEYFEGVSFKWNLSKYKLEVKWVKYINDIKRFEEDYNTSVKQDLKGLNWQVDNNYHMINKTALGLYKRANIDFYKVLVSITTEKFMNGSSTTALKLIKRQRVCKTIK